MEVRVYCVGGMGGNLPTKWVGESNPPLFQIYEGNSDRQWLEVNYVNEQIKPIGKIKTIIPEGPYHPNSLLDACIAFFPTYFQSCPSMAVVQSKLRNATRLDFHLGQANIPEEWNQLREEARFLFQRLEIFEWVVKNKKNRYSINS